MTQLASLPKTYNDSQPTSILSITHVQTQDTNVFLTEYLPGKLQCGGVINSPSLFSSGLSGSVLIFQL